MRHFRLLSLLLAALFTLGDPVGLCTPELCATEQKSAKKGTSSKTKSGTKSKQKGGEKGQQKKGSQSKGRSKKKAGKPRETSAGVKRQEQAVSREIAKTEQQIQANDVAVSTNLATLEGLQRDVAVQEGKVRTLRTRRGQLESNIAGCTRSISQCEKRLATMRAKYIAAVKKMRSARKRTNAITFIFSSKSWYQALRRIRYLKKFSDWRNRQEAQIRAEVARLDSEKKRLATNQAALQSTLAAQEQAGRVLVAKQQQQAQTVAQLRANGDALRTHLARKQQEANDLNARVGQLIAAEQAEALAAEQRRQEQQRIAAEKAKKEQIAAEKRKAEQAERARLEEEKRKAAEAPVAQAAPKPPKDKAQKQPPKQQKPKKEKTRKEKAKKPKSDNKRYADARRRRPREDAPKPADKPAQTPKPAAKPKAAAPAPKQASGFASAKGSLPRPVAGSFTVVSKFGRHPLANLPEVMYDNPGIDAVVSSGASALAVYPGTVTGVYALPGYSTVIIVNHGEYYTVYGNIGTPAVKKGDPVKAGQGLGKLVADPSEGGRTTIHFEVWKNREKQNPEAWIR